MFKTHLKAGNSNPRPQMNQQPMHQPMQTQQNHMPMQAQNHMQNHMPMQSQSHKPQKPMTSGNPWSTALVLHRPQFVIFEF